MNDEQLTELIRAALLFDERLSVQLIDVAVDDGVATLTGSVQTFRRKLAAQQIASEFDAVREVRNELGVEPGFVTPDDEVANNVRASLDAHADITKEAITVAVTGGAATLSGSVGSDWERAIAEDVARSARGVRDVHNRLMVDPFEMTSDEQISGRILTALSHARGLRDAGIHVAMSNSAVVLSGEVDHLWQKETAQTVAQRFRPVRLENDIIVRRRSL